MQLRWQPWRYTAGQATLAPARHRERRIGGFTILELLVACAVFSLILLLMLGVVTNTTMLTSRAGDRISTFQTARTAFDIATAKISEATLNTYWDYDDPARPTRYRRMSELHFLVVEAGVNGFPGTPNTGQGIFFQAPLGFSRQARIRDLTDLLNACGFYVRYAETDALPAPFPASPPRYRYELVQTLERAEYLSIYKSASGPPWYANLDASANVVPIAENVIHFSVWPRRSPGDDPAGNQLTTNFSYDSRLNAEDIPQPVTAHQMPPTMRVTMVVLDDRSAARICVDATPPAVIQNAVDELFKDSNEESFAEDLADLEERLVAANLNFRVFSALIAVRESKIE